MKKKIKLNDLNVNSFVTTTDIKGGSYATCDCSLTTYPQRICDMACSDVCPTDGCSAAC